MNDRIKYAHFLRQQAFKIDQQVLLMQGESDALIEIARCIERGEDFSEYAWRTDIQIPAEFEPQSEGVRSA